MRCTAQRSRRDGRQTLGGLARHTTALYPHRMNASGKAPIPIHAAVDGKDALPIPISIASKLIGFRTKMVRQLISDGLLAGVRIGRYYFTTRHACRVFKHGLVTSAPVHVQALAPTP
jgi:hypothetical protein